MHKTSLYRYTRLYHITCQLLDHLDRLYTISDYGPNGLDTLIRDNFKMHKEDTDQLALFVYSILKPEDHHYTKGTQIAYIPSHACGDISHKDVEFGFIYGNLSQGYIPCRFWQNGLKNDIGSPILRTRSNSERVPIDQIIFIEKYDQSIINRQIHELDLITDLFGRT